MKPTTQTSFAHGHRALLAAAAAILVSAGVAVAQTSGSSGSSTYGSSQGTRSGSSSTDTSRRDQSATSDTSRSSGSSYNTGSSTYSSGTGSTTGTGTATTDTSAAGAPTGRSSMSSDKLSWGDRRFVSKAADSGQDEINLAKLAADKASNAEVKTYAQKLVDDHTQVASELQTLASQKNVKIDKDDDKDRSYKRLSKKSGSDFDQEFVEHMIDEHEKDIKMFEKAASDAKDPEVRSFASKHVDHLRQHLQEAQSLRQTIMPTGRTDTSSSSDKSWRSDKSTGTSSSSDRGSTTGSSRDSSSGYSSGSSSSGTTGSSSDSSGATTPKRDGSR